MEKEKERTWAVEDEARVASLEAEVQDLKKELVSHRAEYIIIAEFKESEEYDQALVNAAAPEIQRCWVITERHIKTDPNAFWGSFVDEFVPAKKAIEDGKGEPEPYDGPSPRFIPAPAPVDPDQDQN